MKKNHSFFTNNLCSTKWMRMLLMSFMLLLSSSLYATTFYIQGDSWLKLSNSNTKMTASSNIYSYTFTSENTGEGKWFKIFKDGSGDSNMLCYSGSDKNVPLNTTRTCTIGGSYTEFKMSVEKGVIYTITVTYTSNNTNVKLKITAKEPIVITPNKEAPYYLKDEITLTATGGKGGNGAYQWYKKEPSESSYTQISGENNASYSFTLDGSYIYKVVDTTTGVESTIDIKPSVKCDDENTKVIFYEDFGWFKDQKDRAKSEYAKYTEKLGCTNIKNGGEYAIVAVPAWGGCTNKSTNVDYENPCDCPVNKEEEYTDVKMWFNKKLDHATEEKYIQSLKSENDNITASEINAKLVEFRKNFETGTDEFRKQHTAAPELEKNKNNYYGGMLLFNCKGGENDLLYEREINVCENTYINFSAWFSKANVSNKDKIGAKFVLLKGSTRTELDSYVIDNIDVNAGWKQISAMFNSKDCEGKVIVQLINYAHAGLEGNDLLVDDISLSICTPEASLHADYAGNQTDNVRAMIGENVDLISGIDNVIFSGSPFYWWQKKEEGSANWTPLTTNPEQDRATYQVSVTNKKTEYRVIVANTSQAAKDAADNLNSDDLCGLYSVTNSVLVEPILLTLTPSRESESICSDDDNTLTLTVENTSSVAINDVYAQVIIPDGLKAYKYGTETAFDGKWEVGNLVANTGMATLKITLKPVNAVTTITSYVIKSYISAIGTNLSWTNYDNAVIKKDISFTVKPVPAKPTFVSEKFYKECALTGSDTKVYFNTLIQGTGLKVYSNKELTNAVEYFAGATPTDKVYYYANQTIEGCTGDTVQFPVTVLELPKLKLAKTDVTSICGTESDSKATLTYEIEGGTAPYTLSIQGIKEGGATETITPSELSTTGTYTLQPTTKTTYTFTKVADANGCYSESSTGLVNDITIEVVNLKIVKGLGDSTVCADKRLEYSIITKGEELHYQWYESTDNGVNKSKVGEDKNTYTTDVFEMTDKGENQKQYYVEVYQDSKVCPAKESKSKVIVQDCSNFTITYSLDKKQVCKGDEVVLTATITNNSDSDLRDVILSQSWDGSQIPSKDAAGTNKKIFVTSGDVASEYDEVNNLWKIETFTAHKSATIKITFSAQEDESFHIYMKESNDVTYQDDAENPAPGDATLDVLEISNPVALDATKNYNGICPSTISKTVKLSDLVTRNATDTLHFYDKDKILLTAEPTFDISTEIPSTKYYINRTEADKCISNNPIPVTIEVYKPVTASIAATKNTICSGTESDVNITVDGTAGFTIVYNNGVNDITKPISGKTLNIAETLISTTTYKLISVTDAHACPANLDGTESVTITVNALPELVSFDIEDSDKIICEGTSTKLNATFTGKAPFKFYINDVETTSAEAEWSMDITEGKQYVIKQLSNENCDSKLTQKDVTLTVETIPVVSLSATDVTLNCTTPTATITASGGAYRYEWQDDKGSALKTGSELSLAQTDITKPEYNTIYTVYGYSEKANCKSVDAKTVNVTEDFVKPVVDIKISETADGTIPERLDCYQQNIKLEADLTNNKETIVEYIWSSGSDNNTTLINNPGTYTLQVKGENGCISDVATETIEQNIVKPEVSIESYITDPVTGNIIPTIELTCANNEITLEGTITNADQYAEDYPNGEFTYLWSDGSTTSSTVAKTPLATSPMEYTLIVTSPNGCLNEVDKAKVTVTENVSAPVLNIESVYKLCPSDTLSVKALSSLLPKTAGVTYKFYDEAGVEIDDFYGASSENPVSTYYVVGTSENGCSSEKVSFDVDFAKNVDFTLTTSQTSMLVGGNETLVTIVPNEDSEVADTYTWLSNGKDILVEGLEYSANLYLDTKFEVTATNRCDTDTQEASVEVLWPTAFTPHNGNGKNDDFAKGMHIIVFNRFYTKIFEGPDGWDGTINGAMNESESIAVPGVYYYSVQLPNGEVKKGTVEIVKVD